MAAASTAPDHPEIARLIAPNPGPLTLGGTNSYVVGRDPAYVIDPGPDDPGHIAGLREEAESRGGLAGVLLTHSHADHTDGVARLGGELLWGAPSATDEAAVLTAVLEAGGEALPSTSGPELAGDRRVSASGAVSAGPDVSAASSTPTPLMSPMAGPFTVVATPGHAAEHVCFVCDQVCFCGDLILGEGSSIVPPAAAGGSLADYMRSLERLSVLDLELICPGHGAWITDPAAKIAEYRAHRAERESKLIDALKAGEQSRTRLLELAWDDVPSELRAAAALAMQAHLEKLATEGWSIGELRD